MSTRKRLQRSTSVAPAPVYSPPKNQPRTRVHDALSTKGHDFGALSVNAPEREELEASRIATSVRDPSRLAVPGVRVHRDAEAARLSRCVGALAFTIGDDVYLGNSIASGGRDERDVLSHELVHVAQQKRSGRIALQRYGDVIPTVADPTVKTMKEFIELVQRIEAANPGLTALQTAEMIRKSKYHSKGWEQLLPADVVSHPVKASGKVSKADVITLEGEFNVALPTGEVADPSHVVAGIEAAHEGKPADWGWYITDPKGLSQLDISTWAGDVGSAAGEWMAAHPISAGTTKEAYMEELAPASDLLGDVEGVALSSHSAASGFAVDLTKTLSDNLTRFYFPKEAKAGEKRRFHTFCSVVGIPLEPGKATLSAAGKTSIEKRVQEFAMFYDGNDPNILSWMTINSRNLSLAKQWVKRGNDWKWFAARFIEFVNRNLAAEGV